MKYLLVYLFFFASFLYAQKSELNAEKSRLKMLRAEIERLENELQKLSSNEKNSLTGLNNLNKQIISYSKIIVGLKNEEKKVEIKLEETQDSIKNIDDSISKLKLEYANYIKWLYMFGQYERLNLLISSSSISQAYARYKYLNQITKKNTIVLKKLEYNRKLKYLLQNKYASELREKEFVLKQKMVEQTKLSYKKNEKIKLLTKLKLDKKNIFSEIESKQKAEIRIKDLIAKLENEELEREKKALEKKLKDKNYTPTEINIYRSFLDFSSMNGKLPWPVQSKKIVRSFGENVNSNTNTVTLNYGIDIKTLPDEFVHAVGDGVVSAIEWLPGYGSVVIITHRDNYRTVYGHVTELEVIEGTLVKAGQIIGKVNNSLEGNILHFEIWNKRIYQNPEEWLVRK